MAKLVFRDGAVTMTMDRTLERIVRRAVEHANPEVLHAVEDATEEQVYVPALRKWPVLTGESKRGLMRDTVVSPTSVEGRIYTDVDYTFFIRPKESYGAWTAWNEYIRKPMAKAAKKLVEALGPRLTSTLAGRR